MPRNAPLSLELSADLVDLLADFARADGESMRLTVELTRTGDAGRLAEVERERATLMQTIVLHLLHDLPAFSAEGDLADALNERDEVYDNYRRTRPAPAN